MPETAPSRRDANREAVRDMNREAFVGPCGDAPGRRSRDDISTHDISTHDGRGPFRDSGGARGIVPAGDGARGPARSAPGPSARRAHDVLARGVLSSLARGRPAAAAPGLASFLAALTAPDRDLLELAVTELLAAGTLPEEIVDRHVPAAARALGESWVADELSFAAVTVAGARLQALVRDLAGDPGGAAPGGRGGTALMILPEGEAHSLGALVAADQLRRAGISTRVALGRSPRDVAAILRAGRYDLALLSYGCGTSLAAVADAVRAVRRAAPEPISVAVGGSIATAPPEAPGPVDDARCGDAARDNARVRTRVGADFVGGDVLEAATACGLRPVHGRAAPPSGRSVP